MTIRVLVADDHPMFREGLAAMLNGQPDIAVVAQAATGREAVAAAAQAHPDVAVLDLRMPDGDGISAAVGVRRTSPETRVLVLTTFDGPADVSAALAAGAHGYLVKSAAPDEIAHAVRAVAAGASVVADSVLVELAQGAASGARRLFPELTDRETGILAALARGLDPDEAAAALGLSGKTVRNNVASITAKLGVRDRAAAVLKARDRGLAGGDPPASAPGRDG